MSLETYLQAELDWPWQTEAETRLFSLADHASIRLRALVGENQWRAASDCDFDSLDLGASLYTTLHACIGEGEHLSAFVYSGYQDRLSILTLLSVVKRLFQEKGLILIDHADLSGVYEGIREALMTDGALRFHHLDIAHDDQRPGQGIAIISFDTSRSEVQAVFPENKNRDLSDRFSPSQPVIAFAQADKIVHRAVDRWTPKEDKLSKKIFESLASAFPDQASPKGYWHEETDKGFTEFFTWGHDQDFGYGRKRAGAMGKRHLEIIAESIEYGYLPKELSGKKVLNVGCWTGGDVLALAGMGARVTGLEEHPNSAAAAQKLCELLEVDAEIINRSLYDETPEWRGRFDLVYISGVIYHVTDPLLALRICFAYLKPGGRIVVETKASKLEGAYCEYSGTLEKGWNWYSPTLETMGRWLVDVGFSRTKVTLHMRPVGRLLAGAQKNEPKWLPDKAGFSRPNSWLEENT